MKFPSISDELRIRRLANSNGRIKAVLDTDIANEIDDPFAIAHALLSPDQIDLRAITIAPYANRSTTPAESQVKSRALGEKTLAAIGHTVEIVEGADRLSHGSAVESDSTRRIIDESKGADPLYVLAIGAATNVASALLIDPTVVERIVVVWLGGHIPDFPVNDEYNLQGDLHASQILFSSGVPLVHYPAMGVTSHLYTSAAATRHDFGDHAGGRFFVDLLQNYYENHFGIEKELWDVGVTSYVVNPTWTQFVLEPTPLIGDDCRYVRRPSAPLYKRATYVSRNSILPDLYKKIASI